MVCFRLFKFCCIKRQNILAHFSYPLDTGRKLNVCLCIVQFTTCVQGVYDRFENSWSGGSAHRNVENLDLIMLNACLLTWYAYSYAYILS